jgi:hypothetical protein
VNRAALERRIGAAEVKAAKIRPAGNREVELLREQCPWLDWITCDELMELAEVCEGASADGRRHFTPFEQAGVTEITARAERRRLAGLPTVDELKRTHQVRVFRAHYDAPRGMGAEEYVYAQLLLERDR